MNTKQKIELVNSVLNPKNVGFLSHNEIQMVRGILGIKDIETKEELIDLRNSVVKFYRSILDSIREMEQKVGIDLGFMNANDKMSGIVAVIDGQLSWKGWM